jgi:hypothetical protein
VSVAGQIPALISPNHSPSAQLSRWRGRWDYSAAVSFDRQTWNELCSLRLSTAATTQ